MKRFLNLDKAIVISNSERVNTGKEIIKNRKHLAGMVAKNIGDKQHNVYVKMHRYEKKGVINVDLDLINKIALELNVDKKSILSDI